MPVAVARTAARWKGPRRGRTQGAIQRPEALANRALGARPRLSVERVARPAAPSIEPRRAGFEIAPRLARAVSDELKRTRRRPKSAGPEMRGYTDDPGSPSGS